MSTKFYTGQKDYIVKLNELDDIFTSTPTAAAAQSAAAAAQSAAAAAQSATVAGNLASAASGSAGIASAQAGTATAQAANAGASATASQSARDAAIIQAGVYVDEPAGRAAVADGLAFKVQGIGGIAAFEYRRTNSTTSALLAIYPAKGAVDTSSVFTRTGYLNLSGALVNDVNWQTTPLLSTFFLEVRALSLYGTTINLSIAFYDANSAFISGIAAASLGAFVTSYPVVPANAVYVAFTRNIQAANGAAQGFFVGIRADRFPLPHNVDYVLYATLPGFIGSNGVLGNSDVNWLSSDFIPVVAGDTVVCDLYGNTALNSLSYYDANKQYVSGVRATANTLPGVLVKQTVTIPAGTGFLRLSHGNKANNTSAASDGSVLPSARSLCSFLKIPDATQAAIYANRGNVAYSSPRKLKLLSTDGVLLYGDSIFSNSYPWLSAAIAGLTGATVTAGGYPGASSAQLAADIKMQSIYASGARLVIVMTGGNDSGAAGTVGTFSGFNVGEAIVAETSIAGDYVGTTYIQSISHIMRKFNAYFGNIRARAGLTGSETEAQKTAKIDAVLKPVLVFCSGIPRNIASSSDISSQPASWLRKRAAVLECAVKYKVHCVDLMTQLPWDMSLEPYYVGPTDTVTNNGVKTMDGVHPNKYGNQDMAETICASFGI